jgi:hypothetical protein
MKNFFFFPRTPKQTKDGQDVFMRGMIIGSDGFLKFNKRPAIRRVGKAGS